MKKLQLWGIGIVALSILFAVFEGAAAAEKKYPTRPIQIVIPFAPGETDTLLRPFIEKMPDYLGQPVSFVYKPGAGSALGGGFVAASKPDGDILLATTTSTLVLIPITNKDISYTLESFAPISCLVEGYLNVAVQANSRWKNMQDLIAEAKKFPGKITYATAGTFALPHIAIEALSKEEGIKFTHVPTTGAGPSVTALLGGHVDFAVAGSGACLSHIKAGKLRSLMVFKEKRAKSLPDVPAAGELRYPVVPLIYGILAPKGVPKEVISTIADACKKVLDNHGSFIESRLTNVGAETSFLGPEDYSVFLKNQYIYFDKVIKGISN